MSIFLMIMATLYFVRLFDVFSTAYFFSFFNKIFSFKFNFPKAKPALKLELLRKKIILIFKYRSNPINNKFV